MSRGREMRYGRNGSLSIDLGKGTWFDHESKQGGGALDCVMHETGLTTHADAMQWAREFNSKFNGNSQSAAPQSKPNGKGEHGSDEEKRTHGDRFPGLGKPIKVYD